MPGTYDLVTLDLARKYLRADGTDNDDTISLLISAATKKTEDYCGTYWVKRGLTERRRGPAGRRLWLYRSPITAVESVTVSGQSYMDWEYNQSSVDGWWPPGAEISVTYTAGHIDSAAGAGDVIPDAVAAVLLLVSELYNNPAGMTQESVSGIGAAVYDSGAILPDRVKALLSSLRRRPVL